MSRTEGRSSPILGHPMALPTLFVVGGWALLIGGYLPGQEGRPDSPEASGLAGPPQATSPHSTVPYPYAYPDPSPAAEPPPVPPTVLDHRGGDGPIRVTIEFPNRPGDSASVVINEPRPDPASEDRDATRTASRIDPGVVPPPIPGPPPGFDPIVLSPLMPDSVPLSAEPLPILGGKDESANPVLARTLDELPESFEPRSLLDRHRQGFGAEEGAEPVGAPDPGDAFGDRAPAPPRPPVIDPMGDLERDLLATRPKPIEILPEPEPEPLAEPNPPAPVPASIAFEPPPVSAPPATEGPRTGILGRVFGKRDRADRRRNPARPGSVVPESIGVAREWPTGPSTPSDVLVDTDWIFRAGTPPEPSSPSPTPPPVPVTPPNAAPEPPILAPIEALPIAPEPNPSPRFEAPRAESSSSTSRADSGLVRKVRVAIPKLDQTLLQSRLREEESARAAAMSDERSPDHDASIDPE